MPSRELYLDLDGSVANFRSAFCALVGQDEAVLNERVPRGKDGYFFNRYLDQPMQDSDFWGYLHLQPSWFWEQIKRYNYADTLLAACREACSEWYFCSSGNPARIKWLEQWVGLPVLNAVFTHHKHKLARDGRLLIDDHEETADAWASAGGEVIVFPQIWNRRYGEAGKDAYKVVIQEIKDWSQK